ncbi:sensor histidine kinase [Lederbergia lenta]|uniref:Two-component sensor histidine kinase n=1 Tax=Lederbergia lenta TaxID=1467 RepID=A0A2X4WGZ3_LEDLE|nr:sensor histidine kinase [Lederbergia lenta]MEC2322958.1 sensor histidine kinase [Lederbergia lenta]SQI62109.1 two-component sensor histidine kinase [Lederbergia lenta]
MTKFLGQFKSNGLFFKMFIVMVVSIISVSVLITYNTIRMSEKLFMETFSITNYKVLSQIKTSFETFSFSIVRAANNVQQSGTVRKFLTADDTDSMSVMKNYYDIIQQMKGLSSPVDEYEVNMVITGLNGRAYSTNYYYWPTSEEDLKTDPITLNTLEEPNRLLYQYDPADEMKNYPSIVISKALVDRSTQNHYGVLYISIRESDFKQFYSNYTSEGNDVILLNPSGTVVSSNREDLLGIENNRLLEHAKEIEEMNLDYKDIEVFGKSHVMIAEYLPTYGMYLVNLIDRESVTNNIVDTKAIVMISIFIVSVALLIVYFISRRLTKSLTMLVQEISNMAKYNFGQYVTVKGSYETKELANAFNYMLDELHDYVEQLVETQKKQRNAELAALQQQINPHFLYNTLTSVKIMVQQGNKEKSANTIHALISLLQNSIGNVSETVTVEEELEMMKNYIYINQVRYGDRIKVNYFISPDCLPYQLPKLILQPFIENAFFHGFNRKYEGYIHILIAEKDNKLICEVIDNGDGMEVNASKEIQSHKNKRHLFSGIGIRNVDERIKLLYGEEFGIEILSEVGEGTRIIIQLPLITDRNNAKI